MSLATPTTGELTENIVGQVESAIGEAVPLLPKAFARVFAKAWAAVLILVYKYAGFIFLQLFVAHATMRETTILGVKLRPLVEWGRLIGVGDPEPATQAEHTVNVTVTNQTGSLPAFSQLVHPSSGVVHLTTAAVALDDDTVQVTVRASSDQDGGQGAGVIGNLEVGDVVSFANPLPNVATDAVVAAQTVTGADAESADAYRQRIIRRFQRRPQGGAYADYQQWGEEPPGILNVYPYTGDPGEVDVYVEATPESSGDPDGIPTSAQLTEVQESIDLDDTGLASRRPANAAVNVLPISRVAFDVEVVGLIADDEPAAEAAIEAAVDEHLRSREPFIVGLSLLPRRDRITAAAVAGVVDEAASAVGATITSVTVEQGAAEIQAYTLGDGEKAKLGTITFS
jgi:uncharacterized phage protein gp47/JayE